MKKIFIKEINIRQKNAFFKSLEYPCRIKNLNVEENIKLEILKYFQQMYDVTKNEIEGANLRIFVENYSCGCDVIFRSDLWIPILYRPAIKIKILLYTKKNKVIKKIALKHKQNWSSFLKKILNPKNFLSMQGAFKDLEDLNYEISNVLNRFSKEYINKDF